VASVLQARISTAFSAVFIELSRAIGVFFCRVNFQVFKEQGIFWDKPKPLSDNQIARLLKQKIFHRQL
jgi:hypothetical protein